MTSADLKYVATHVRLDEVVEIDRICNELGWSRSMFIARALRLAIKQPYLLTKDLIRKTSA